MPFSFTCPVSGKTLNLPDNAAGRAFRCPACGEVHKASSPEPYQEPQETNVEPGTDAPSATISVACPSTGENMQLPARLQGARFKCPLCGQIHEAPGQAAQPEQPPTEEPARTGSRTTRERSRIHRAARRRGEEKPQTFMQMHWWKIALPAAAVVIAVIALLAVHLGNQRHRDLVLKNLGEAERQYDEGTLDAALERAAAAEHLLAIKPSAFGAVAADGVRKRIKLLRERHGQFKKADELYRNGLNDPVGTRLSLQSLLKIVEGAGERTEPVIKHINQLLAKIDARELKFAEDKAGLTLAEAKRLYDEGKIEDAASKAQETAQIFKALPEALQTKANEKYASEILPYQQRLELLEKGRQIERKAAQDQDFQKAISELEQLIAQVPADDTILKDRLQGLLSGLKFESEAADAAEKATEGKIQNISTFALTIANSSPRISFDRASVDAAKSRFTLELNGERYDISIIRDNTTVAVTSRGYYFGLPAQFPTWEAVLQQCGTLAEAMEHAGVEKNSADALWGLLHQLPAPAAVLNQQDGNGIYSIFIKDRTYQAQRAEPPFNPQEVSQEYVSAANNLAQAIVNDQESDPQVRVVVATVVAAAYGVSRPNDYLSRLFCRRVIEDGYIKQHLPGFVERHGDLVEAYGNAYKKIAAPVPLWTGPGLLGSASLEGFSTWRFLDEEEGTTTFAYQHPERAHTGLFIHTTFQGKHDAWPDETEPLRVCMVHRVMGEVSRYDVSTGKFTADEERWRMGAVAMQRRGLPDYFGEPEWRFPPHVVMIDPKGDTKALITSQGRLDMPDFSQYDDDKTRLKQQDKFMDKCAQVLLTPGQLHLFFVNFANYTLDSPVEKRPNLLGSSQHSGDIHQDYHQYLDRKVGGRFIGDCDDVAEFYKVITDKQGRLSYVLGVPHHATCGWVEKRDDNKFEMFFVDTMPPRRFVADTISEVVEKGIRSYDQEGTTLFDPNSVEFLFRFAGEPTRTRYYLSTRMFEDKRYAETMIRVQSYWHFHTYQLAIRTMLALLQTDKDPANCFELASLYGRTHEIDKAVKWLQTGIEGLPKNDMLSRVNHHLRYAWFYKTIRNDEKSLKALEEVAQMLDQIPKDAKEQERYIGVRFTVAGGMAGLKSPWKGWSVIRDEVKELLRQNRLSEQHGNTMLGVYYWMKKLQREGRKLNVEEADTIEELKSLASSYVDRALFKDDDSFTTVLFKYSSVALLYAAELGDDHVRQELLKNGPFPSQQRLHTRRANPEEEDWKWIRLSISAYGRLVGQDLDDEKPKSEQKPDDAVALIEAAMRATMYARRIGSLASQEYMLIGLLINRAAIKKDWMMLENILHQVKESGSARLHHLAARTLGDSARFIEPSDFKDKVMPLYTRYIEPRPHYFELVYEAYDARAYKAAAIAADVAAEKFKDFSEMRQEKRYLEKLIEDRLKEKD